MLPLTAPLRWRLGGEGLGTFFLVLIGPGAAMADAWSGGRVTHVGVALAFAFVITGVVAVLGPLSGAHINPAVSIAMAWRGKLGRRELVPYLLAQLAGAVLAAAFLRWLLGPVGHNGATLPAVGVGRSFALEGAMSLVLGLVAFRSRGSLAPLAIGLTVGFCALMGGTLTGASMNPARSFGPALVGGEWAGHWIYWIAPVVGMLIAAAIDRGLDSNAAQP
ncbi:MAG: aquaporin [Gemmatimonadetes bacterium]|nr:aquaporin [Gemmatimonadota bacterium]